jgi:stage IV sporulation protein FB
MELTQDPENEQQSANASHTGNAVAYPPKFVKKEEPSNVWVKSLVSLGLYLVLGYYIFKRWEMLLLITAIVIIHEMGHFIAMKYYRYNELGIFFIPLLGAYVSGSKREVSQKESAVILLAGPLPGILIGIGFHLFYLQNPYLMLADISYERIAQLFIFLNIINLLPIYPLDGGQLLNRVFLDEEGWLSKVFVFLSAALMVWLAWKLEFWLLLIFPVMMMLRLQSDTKFTTVEKRIEAEGINIDTSYENLRDEDYWKIRQILVTEHPAFKDISPAPPYTYSPKEEKVMTTIEGLLHRHLIQDISIAGKLFIFLICVAALASPWLIGMDMSFFQRFVP